MRARLAGLLLLVLPAVVAAGCAHTRSAASRPPAGAEYGFAFVAGDTPSLAVTLRCAGAADGKTTLETVKSWGGIDDAQAEVHDLRVSDGNGAALPVTHADRQWHVEHAPGAPLVVSYRLSSTNHPLGNGSETYYRPIVTAHLVHLIGETALVYPRHLDDETPRRFTVKWRDLPSGWQTVGSFGAGDVSVDVPLGALRHSLFIASDELHLLPRAVGAGTVMLGVVGAWARSDALADTAARVVTVERRFFSDAGPPFFLISLIPLPGRTCSSKGGTGLTHSFALFFSQPCPIAGDTDPWLPTMLAHELFHGWNPRTTEREAEGTSYWFSEGFTNFYARRLMYRAGILTLDGYVANLNEELASAALSPERGADNARVVGHFWRSRDVEKVPYWRGDLAALLIDAALRRASDGKRNLDDLYRHLVAESGRGAALDTPGLLALLERETSPALAAALRHAIVDGAPLALDPSLLAPCLRGERVTRPTFDLGLDLPALQQRHEIAGVRPDSNAARAGVRAGMKLAGFSLESDPQKEVELRVREDGAVRTIRWLPQGEKRELLELRVNDAQACAGL